MSLNTSNDNFITIERNASLFGQGSSTIKTFKTRTELVCDHLRHITVLSELTRIQGLIRTFKKMEKRNIQASQKQKKVMQKQTAEAVKAKPWWKQ